jgi:uncharacterized protein
MQIVWDESKRLANIDKHGLDFADSEEGFAFDTALRIPARPSNVTGRPRDTLIGHLGSELVVVVVSSLGSEALSLISLRRASPTERRLYEQNA